MKILNLVLLLALSAALTEEQIRRGLQGDTLDIKDGFIFGRDQQAPADGISEQLLS